MVKANAGLKLEALAEPLHTVLGGTDPLPETAERAAFVCARLMGHEVTHTETRALVGAIRGNGRQQPVRRERQRPPDAGHAPVSARNLHPNIQNQREARACQD